MTIQAQVSVYSQVFVPREYDVFAGLDVDKKSMAVIFTDHEQLMQSSESYRRIFARYESSEPEQAKQLQVEK